MTAAEPPPPTDPAARAPLLSVTVLNYNYGRFLGQCLDEVLAQSYPHFEVIVVDDCSQDDSLRVVEPYLADPRVRLVAHTTNQGFTRSLIEATEEHSRGEFVMVISADDRTLRPDAFARQLALLIERPDVAWVHTAFERFDSASGRLIEAAYVLPQDTVLSGVAALRSVLLDVPPPMHSGTIIRKSAYDAAGGYRRDILAHIDYAIWPLLCLEGAMGYLAQPLYGYRMHGAQMTRDVGRMRRDVRDTVSAIQAACARARERGLAIGDLERETVRKALFQGAANDAWSGRPRAALRRWSLAARARPDALASRYPWLVLARLLLGERLVGGLRQAYRRARGRGPAEATT